MNRPTVGLILALAAVLAAAAAHAQEDPRVAEARERARGAERLFDQGDFGAALAEFQRIHELLDGHPYQVVYLYNIGRAHERLFQYDRALDAYRRYLQHGGPDADRADEVRAKLELLEGLLGTVRLAVRGPDAYEVWVDDQRVGADLDRVRVPAGSHVVEIRATGWVPAREQITVAARTEREATYELERLSVAAGISPVFFWGSVGFAVVSVAVGATLGVMALGERSQVDELNDDSMGRFELHADAERRRSKIQDLALAADIAFGAAVLFAAGAVLLAFGTDFGGEETPDPGVSAALFPGGGGLVLRGGL